MTTTTEEASPAVPAQTRLPGLGAALGVGGAGLLLAQIDGIARTAGVLLLVVGFAVQLGADAAARVLAALPPVLRELPRSCALGNGCGLMRGARAAAGVPGAAPGLRAASSIGDPAATAMPCATCAASTGRPCASSRCTA